MRRVGEQPGKPTFLRLLETKIAYPYDQDEMALDVRGYLDTDSFLNPDVIRHTPRFRVSRVGVRAVSEKVQTFAVWEHLRPDD